MQPQGDLLGRILELTQRNIRVAILMSGKGTNARKILENRKRYPNLSLEVIVTNSSTSNAAEVGSQFNVPVVVHQEKDSSKLFKEISNTLQDFNIDLLIYAGFMKVSPSWFVKKFPGINLHPADLTQVGEDGTPKYTGMDAVQNAIADRVLSVSSTLHVVDTQVDHGAPIAVSKPLELSGTGMEESSEVHERMKIHCEHITYPYMLELLSKGRVARKDLPIHL